MTKFRDTILVGAALILGTVATASAADLNRGSLKDGSYMPAIAQSPTVERAWYVRLDGGIASYDRPTMVLTELSGNTQEVIETSIDRQWSLGGGIGAYFGRSARVDATIERRFKTDVKGTFLAFDPNSCTLCPVHGSNSLQSTVLMANFYYDFNRGSHFTPYVGVGLGAVRHEVGAGRFSSGDGKLFGTIDGNSSWHAAGALMAGVDVKMRDRLHLDAGYRFLYLGHTSTGATTQTSAKVYVPVAQDPTIEQIHAHEFRLGLRSDIQYGAHKD